MASLIAIPFLIGSVPLGLAVVGANHFLKDKRKTNKFLYWGGITASAFGGWVVSNMLMTRYVESQVLSAEQKFKEPYMKGDKLDMKRGNDGRFRRRLVIPLKKNADTFNSDSHTDSFMADYKDKFKNWKPSAYPYEKRITQDSDNEACNSCGEEKVHYQFYLAQKNSRYPKIRFLDGPTYCQYDTNTCGGNICGDCAENASCENCGAEICTYCENEDNYDHADLVCVDCREFNESLED